MRAAFDDGGGIGDLLDIGREHDFVAVKRDGGGVPDLSQFILQIFLLFFQLTILKEGLVRGIDDEYAIEAITLDGREIMLSANVEQITDTVAVVECGAQGVGLFRTEYLFLDRKTLPSEEEQYTSYQRVAKAIAPEAVIFRTLDIGADKISHAIGETDEANPFLGWRAIRFCLARPDIFRTQLRALLRASAGGNVKLMYPMISGAEELDQANELLEECKAELRAEGTAFD